MEAAVARVLVVDDEESQIRMLVSALRHEGFDAFGIRDADAVMDLLQRDLPDLVLVDLMMPGLNGIELARKIRDAHPSVRVVLTSAYHLSERQLSRADCGVVGFVPKPYVLPELAEFLRAKIKVSRVTLSPDAQSTPRLCAS
jgi:DNA-binding response OmpR family regulator